MNNNKHGGKVTMLVKQFRTGGDRNFGYLVADDVSKQAAVIDPSYSPEVIVQFAKKHGYEIKYVFNTHNHFDHTNGNKVIKKLTGKTPLLFGSKDPLSGIIVSDGTKFALGGLEITILHTPGHTADSICILVADAVFTGDTLFVGKVGGTDFNEQARSEYDSLHQKLLALPGSIRVFPGHDYGTASQSSILHERQTNPFVLQPDIESFIHLKRNWAAYKKEHGIA